MNGIRLLIDDYSAPWAETYCTVQSFKRQQGGVDHRPVQYRVATDFPGVVTMTTPAGVVRTLTADYSATLPLDEGGVTIKADGSAVSELENGTYYVWLKQEESSLELEVTIAVDLCYSPHPDIVEYPNAFGGPTVVAAVAADACGLTLTLAGCGVQYSINYPALINGALCAPPTDLATPGDVLTLPVSWLVFPLHGSEHYSLLYRLNTADFESHVLFRIVDELAQPLTWTWEQTGAHDVVFRCPVVRRRKCWPGLPSKLRVSGFARSGSGVLSTVRWLSDGHAVELALDDGHASVLNDMSAIVDSMSESDVATIEFAWQNLNDGDQVFSSVNFFCYPLPYPGSVSGYIGEASYVADIEII